MKSLRKYIKNLTELEEYITLTASFDVDNLIRAERDIDKVVASFYEGGNRPSVSHVSEVYSAVLTSTQATVTGLSPINTGYYDYCTLEILSGSNKGLKIAINSQSSNVLTFFETQSGLSETSDVKIYQSGKFPRLNDTTTNNSIYYKTIPEFVKEAVALQYEYRLKEGVGLDSEQVQSSYSVNQSSYSESFDVSRSKTIRDRISPQAIDLLEAQGLTIQTI